MYASAKSRFDVREVATVLKQKAGAMAFSPDGKRLAIARMSRRPTCPIDVVDTATWKISRTYVISTLFDGIRRGAFEPEGFRSVAFSPDGRWLVAGTRHGLLHIWDTTEENPQRISRQANERQPDSTPPSITRLAFSPDGEFLYSNVERKLGIIRFGGSPIGRRSITWPGISTYYAVNPQTGDLAVHDNSGALLASRRSGSEKGLESLHRCGIHHGLQSRWSILGPM